jgi:hypothetical protein
MQIKGSRILLLGGWGLVGAAISRELMKHSPSRIYISSLKQHEAEEAVENLRNEYKDVDPDTFQPLWGNIFTRTEWKDRFWGDVLKDAEARKGVISDIYDNLSDDIMKQSALNGFITEANPDLVIDCINTATAIAYQDIYNTVNAVRREILQGEKTDEVIERMMSSDYIPQLIRHIQIFYKSLVDNKVNMYVKIGTSGTGGMGLNIPYTHSEERPSRVLLAKSAVAGAQTLLLFLMARTPNGPLVKEIKPTATIAWKKIAYGKIYKKGQPIKLVDMKPEDAREVGNKFKFKDSSGIDELGKDFESVFIDTGENGIFSRGEFEAISALGQMEIVTPEEIATYTVHEILAGNTGRDVLNALDASTLGPTYRGGWLKHFAVDKIKKLEKEHDVNSVAFELLGPPRLSKLLYEAHLLKRAVGSYQKVLDTPAEQLAEMCQKVVIEDKEFRAQMLSIGLVILLNDGKKYLRGKEVKIPVNMGDNELEMTEENINSWCKEGWVDLRPSNFVSWQERITNIMEQTKSYPQDDTSSRYAFNMDYWENFETIDEGKIIGWVFEHEDKGWRFKR